MFNFLSKSVVRRLNAIILSLISIGLLAFAMLIGIYNYNRSIQDLKDKAKNTLGLTKIALQDPIYNVDEEGLSNIVKAIMLDEDVVAFLVFEEGEEEPMLNERLEAFKDIKIEEMKKNEGLIYTQGTIKKEDDVLGNVHVFTSTQKVQDIIVLTSTMIAAFAVLLIILLAIFVALSANKIIKKPIIQLKESANELAQGNLEKEIDTRRNDELGSLAHSFAEMRDAIRKKIQDLGILNSSGEELAAQHDQTKALQIAIRVMEEQTFVERGSVYLLNPESKELEIKAFYPGQKDVQAQAKNFKLGEGILGKVAQEKNLIHIPDTSKDPQFIGGESSTKPRALLCIPMMDDKNVFGVMNFSGEVEKVRFEKSDGEFAQTIARMTVVSTKNIQMMNVIAEQNRTLEQKVLERTSELRQKTNDINNMLQNMHQGIFTIIEGNLIHHEYSTFVEDIMEIKEVAGAQAMKFLFDHSDLGSNALDQISTALGAGIGEDLMMFEFNSHLLINEYQKIMPDGRFKILELDWDPIANENDEIEKIMVTVRDVTELRGLQAEAEKQKRELEIIGQILTVSRKKFKEFVKTSNSFIKENEKLIQETNDKNPETIASLFRNMHTIKGNARTYGFNFLTDAVHEAEQTYDELRHKDEVKWNKEDLLKELKQTEEFIKEYENVFEAKLGSDYDAGVIYVDKQLLNRTKDSVTKASADNSQSLEQVFRDVDVLIKSIGTEPMSTVLEGIFSAIPPMAKELDKIPPKIVLNDNNVRLHSDITPTLKDVFMHTFRNSMDHGLEIPEDRKKAGKPEKGTMTLDVNIEGDKVVFHFYDDGRGLALGRIKQKAIDNGVLKADEHTPDVKIAELVFHSGLSTTDKVSKISGRGVGMDAVKRFLQKQGGDIQLCFIGDAQEGSDFRPFESRITLPAKYTVKT